MITKDPRTEEQNLALKKWAEAGFRGTWFAVTGTGKSRAGVIAAGEFIRRNSTENALIIIPNQNLRDNEWPNEFKRWGYANELDKVEIECIQTAYKWTGKHYNTLVIDEVHVSLAPQFKNLLLNNTFDRILCLTATIDDEDKKEFLKSMAPIVHVTDMQRALKLKLISPHTIYNLGVTFTENEQKVYDKVEAQYKDAVEILGGARVAFDASSRYLKFKKMNRDGSNVCVYVPANQVMYTTNINNVTIHAKDCRPLTEKELISLKQKIKASQNYWAAMRARRKICIEASNKLIAIKEILDHLPDRKAIVFSQSIEFAERVCSETTSGCTVFHSKLKQSEKEAALSEFSMGHKRVISAVKALDAGFNVPDCSLGIDAAGSGKSLQSTQRSGRVLRLVEGKRAIFVNLYVKDSQEWKWVYQRTKEQNPKWISQVSQIQ